MTSALPRLGGYLLERRLAGGGTAELLLARRDGGPPVVLKRLLPQYQADPEHARMFLNEARLSLRFAHPNIVRTFAVESDPTSGQPFMVMEYLDGPDLRTLLRSVLERGHRVPAGVATQLMLQTLDALAYAHALADTDGTPLGVVHRDVSLANVVVTMDGVAKLIDFGIVRAQINEGDTRTGELKGSVAYMSPEQIGGRALDGRADLFAVGVCLYELVTGVHPFRRAHELATFNAILDEQPAPLSKWAPTHPPELEEVIRGALAKPRDGRYPSARTMRQALEAVPGVADPAAVAALVRTVYTSPFEAPPLPSWAADGETETLGPREPGLDQDLTLRAPDDSFDGHTITDGARSSGEHDTAVSTAVPLPRGLDATLPPLEPRRYITAPAVRAAPAAVHGTLASAADTLDQTLPPPDPVATTAPTLPPALRALRGRPPHTPEPARPPTAPLTGLHLLLLLMLIVLLALSLVALWTGRLDGLLPWPPSAR